MIIPEKTHNVRRIVVPAFIFKGAAFAAAFLVVLAMVMIFDYANVMNQIGENKVLRSENRQLRQNVQQFKDKMLTIEGTLDRVRTFATKLRIITNIEENAPTGQRATSLPRSEPPFLPQATSSRFLPEGDAPGVPPAPLPKRGTAPAPSAAPAEGEETGGIDTSQNEDPDLSKLMAILSEGGDAFVSFEDEEVSKYVEIEFKRLEKGKDYLEGFAIGQEKEIQDIFERLADKKSMLLSMPTRIPTLGYITSGFGVRFSPYGGKRKMHEGIDIANRYGAEIIAPGDGVILFAGVKPGYGKILAIDHGYGLRTYYGHTSQFYVLKGQKVNRGQRIAAIGSTGRSTGPHVHYEVHVNGTPIDPIYYILDR